LQAFVFIHPQRFRGGERLQGNGFLSNVIGQPLETTVALSHLNFEGTLDRFPKLKIVRPTEGDSCRPTAADGCLLDCLSGNLQTVKKEPSEYLKQLYFDSIVVTGEVLGT